VESIDSYALLDQIIFKLAELLIGFKGTLLRQTSERKKASS